MPAPCGVPLSVSCFSPLSRTPARKHAMAGQIRPKVPKLATIMDDAEPDVLAYMIPEGTSPTAATIALAVIGPTPGAVASRRLSSLFLCHSTIFDSSDLFFKHIDVIEQGIDRLAGDRWQVVWRHCVQALPQL